MNDTDRYNVLLTGTIRTGYERDLVVRHFAGLFKISEDKAAEIVGTRRVLKKDVSAKAAAQYQKKLGEIGVDIALQKLSSIRRANQERREFTLVGEDDNDRLKDARGGPAGRNQIVCPKCRLVQPRSESCSRCGVFFHKFGAGVPQPGVSDTIAAPPAGGAPIDNEVAQDDGGATPLSGIVAAVVVAVLGALLWQLIAVQFGYEVGFVAWLIGGAVGLAAAALGARGNTAGAVCAVLALLSIFGGKYLAFSSFQPEISAAVAQVDEAEIGEVLRPAYEQQLEMAERYAALSLNDDTLRAFVADYGYTEQTDPARISNDEIEYFKEYVIPQLEQIAANPPSFQQWRQNMQSAPAAGLSPTGQVFSTLSWVDALFLMLGLGTAFRLARGSAD